MIIKIVVVIVIMCVNGGKCKEKNENTFKSSVSLRLLSCVRPWFLRCWENRICAVGEQKGSLSGISVQYQELTQHHRCKLPVLWSTQLRVGCSALPTDRPAAEIRVQALSLCLFQTYLKLTIAENEWKNTKHHLAWCFEVDVFLLTWNSFSKYPASIKSCKCTINQSRGNKWPVLFK